LPLGEGSVVRGMMIRPDEVRRTFQNRAGGFTSLRLRLGSAGLLVLVLLCAVAPLARAEEPAEPAAQSVARKKQLALKYFDEAERMREALNGRPTKDRSLDDYGRVMDAYRKVYYTAPTSPKANVAVVAIAELLAESGRIFDHEKNLRDAIGQYEFLRKEYPGSRYRFDALFTIAQIYKDDLQDADAAKAAFQDFLKQYPSHHLANDAREEIAEIDQLAKDKQEAANDSKTADGKSQPRVLVTGVRHWSTPDYTRVVIDLQGEVEFTIGKVDNPDRIYFDLKNTKLASMLRGKSFDVDDGFLRQIRLGQYQPDETRVVLDVSSVSDYSAFLLPNPARLIVDIRGDAAAGKAPVSSGTTNAGTANTGPTNTETTNAASKIPADAKEKEAAAVATEVHQARPTKEGERSLVRALGLKIGRIVVDAGHGGHDTGTIASNGLREKDLVLDVAQRLGKLLEEDLGAEVIYTRDDDTFVPLETRTAIANKQQADLFISIHANSSPTRSVRGVETYYLNFTTSAHALEVAARENAVSSKSIHELQDLVQKITLKDKMEESREFATEVQRSMQKGLYGKTEVHDRGVRQAPFIVLIGANMPSILAEISFVSNPTDARKLKSGAYRQKIADSLYQGILHYVSGLSGVKVAARGAAN
jgi:N-acetylmuramoyl-L-alanine amidase